MTYADLLRDALLEIAVIDPIDPIPPDLFSLALTRFNGILNQRNASQLSVYAVTFPTFTTTSGLSPHTIGPTGATWTVTQRPVAILGANQQSGSGVTLTNIGPLTPRDRAWWLGQGSPNVQSGVPTDFYYEPTWPNGSVYLWPVPNAAYTVQLETRIVLSEVAEADVATDFSMPPGYQRDLTLSLAEDLAGALSVPVSGALQVKAMQARSLVESNNNPPIRIATRQAGMPGGGVSGGGGFNWRTGRGGGR